MSLTPSALMSIYDAAISERNWNRALDACAAAMGADQAMLYAFQSVSEVNYAIEETSSGFADISDMLAEYNQTLAEGRGTGYDQEGLGYVQTQPPHIVIPDDDIWTLDAAYQARAEVEIGMRAGLRRRSFINLSDDPNRPSGLIFLYSRDFSVPLPGGLGEISAALGPHVAKAAELHRFTHGLRAKYNAVLSVLDRIGTGVFVVTSRGEPVVSNRMASAAIEGRDGLQVGRDGRLTCRDADAGAELLAAIDAASATAQGENDTAGRVVQIPRAGAAVPLVAIVSPLRDADMEIEKGLSGALVTLIDPLQPMRVQADMIATAYGLSQAEARVAQHLLHGKTNREIAETLNVSPETIKTQISSVLSKCGCRNRLDFLWRVFQLAPPIL